jgi:hypothetical protein
MSFAPGNQKHPMRFVCEEKYVIFVTGEMVFRIVQEEGKFVDLGNAEICQVASQHSLFPRHKTATWFKV